ncbi:MAG: hypothetical protein Q4D96_02325 [Propionibacteriaceae bacterium]|nr:hypothetical protein [Propionibacteriaceae bacterium]
MELWDQQGKRASIKADVQGVFAAAEFSGDQPSQWFASNGNTIRDQTNISRLDRATCSVHSHRTKEAGAFGVAEVNDHVVLSHLSLGDRTWLEVYSQSGELITTYQTGRDAPGALGAANENLLALTPENPDYSDESNGTYGPLRILVLKQQGDKYTEESRFDVSSPLNIPPVVSDISDATILGNTVYFVLPDLENQDVFPNLDETRSALSVADLTTGEITEIPLEQDVPYQVEQHGGMLYVAHTYLNPTIREFEEYRYISRVNPATRQVETFDVGPRLKQIAFSDGLLYVLHDDAIETPTLEVYDPATMERLASHELTAPTGGHYFIGTIGLGVATSKPE